MPRAAVGLLQFVPSRLQSAVDVDATPGGFHLTGEIHELLLAVADLPEGDDLVRFTVDGEEGDLVLGSEQLDRLGCAGVGELHLGRVFSACGNGHSH